MSWHGSVVDQHRFRLYWLCRRVLAVLALWASSARATDAGAARHPAAADSSYRPTGNGTWIVVRRLPGSEACPDDDTVFRAMELLFPERYFRRATAPDQASSSARVTIRPLEAGHEARVEVLSPRHGERVIVAEDPSCHGLADALAVALGMLTDGKGVVNEGAIENATPPSTQLAGATHAEATVERGTSHPLAAKQPHVSVQLRLSQFIVRPPPTPSATPNQPQGKDGTSAKTQGPTTAERRETIEAGMQDAAKPHAWSVHARAGATGGLWVLTQPMVGGLVGVTAQHGSGLGFELSGIGLWALPAEDGRGSVQVSRVGAQLGLCLERQLSSHGRYLVCVEFGLGDQAARTKGFDQVDVASQHDLWLWLGPKLGYVHEAASRFDAFVSVGAQANVTRDNIIVVDSTASVRAHAVGLVGAVGLRWGGPRS